MRVFISWSGELSRQLGEVLRDWLPSALQFVRPYFSSNDIEKGTRWEGMLTGELSESSVGLFVMTKENRGSKWLHFEAGAIAKIMDRSRVCPILFGLEPTDLEGPLALFQSTRFTKDDMRKLFMSINTAGGDLKLPEVAAGKVFDKWWPDLETQLATILKGYKPVGPELEVRSERKLIEEILERVRKISTDLPSRSERWQEGADFRKSIAAQRDISYDPKRIFRAQIAIRGDNVNHTDVIRQDTLRTIGESFTSDEVHIPNDQPENPSILMILVQAGALPTLSETLRIKYRDLVTLVDIT